MLFTIAKEIMAEMFWLTYGRDYTDAELTLVLWAEGVTGNYGVVEV